MGILSNIGDTIFGTPPKTKITAKPTVTSQQNDALNQLLDVLRSPLANPGQSEFQGNVQTAPIPLENLSLTALEDRVKQIGTGGNPLEQATNQSILDIIKSGGTQTGGQGFEDFFKTNVEDPLTKGFNTTHQQLGARFGGNALFTGDRAEADARAKDDFLTQLTGNRANLAFQDRQNSIGNLMSALQLSQSGQGKTSDELTKILGAGQTERDLNATDKNKVFQQWLAEQQNKQAQIQQLLQAIGLPTFENIAKTSGGQTGLLPSIIGAGGSIIGGMASGGTGLFK